MGKSKSSSTLGVHLENDVVAEIIRRAALLNWSKSQYAAEVLVRWYYAGAQPVNSLETALLLPVARDKSLGGLSPLTYVGSMPRPPGATPGEQIKFPPLHQRAGSAKASRAGKSTGGDAKKTAL